MAKKKFDETLLSEVLQRDVSDEERNAPFVGLREVITIDDTPKPVKKMKVEKTSIVEEEPEEIYEKYTLEISKTNIGKIRSMSFWGKKTIKSIVNGSLDKTIKSYEMKNGELKLP